MSNLSEKVSLPKERIPKPFSQNVYKDGRLFTTVNSCVTCSIVKVIEVLYAIKNGYYTELSKGYAYVKHSGKTENGTASEIVLESMLEKGIGTVPYDMCADYTQKPEICNIIETRADLAELDKEAEKWSIESWERVKCNNSTELKESIIKHIRTHNTPIIGDVIGKNGLNHCVVITGCDDDYIYYHDHDKKGEECRAKYSKWKKSFYYISISEGGNDMEFTDVKETDWFYEAVKTVCEKGIMEGVGADKFDPNKPLTRAEAATIICRLINNK